MNTEKHHTHTIFLTLFQPQEIVLDLRHSLLYKRQGAYTACVGLITLWGTSFPCFRLRVHVFVLLQGVSSAAPDCICTLQGGMESSWGCTGTCLLAIGPRQLLGGTGWPRGTDTHHGHLPWKVSSLWPVEPCSLQGSTVLCLLCLPQVIDDRCWCSKSSYVESLASRTSVCDLSWKQDHCRAVS